MKKYQDNNGVTFDAHVVKDRPSAVAFVESFGDNYGMHFVAHSTAINIRTEKRGSHVELFPPRESIKDKDKKELHAAYEGDVILRAEKTEEGRKMVAYIAVKKSVFDKLKEVDTEEESSEEEK